MLEGLHQLGHPTESHGEGQTRAAVAVGYLDTLVGKVPLPVRIMTQFILTKDVRDEVPCVEEKEENIVFSFFFFLQLNLHCTTEPTRDNKKKGLTFTAGWGEVVHQEGKEIVELQKEKKKVMDLSSPCKSLSKLQQLIF